MNNWIGIPYKGEKFCRELARSYLAERGIPMPVVDDPDAAPDWIKVEFPMPDDVVVFNRAGRPSHVGICLGSGDFLHVEEGCKSRIDRLSSPLWKRRTEGFYRYKGRGE